MQPSNPAFLHSFMSGKKSTNTVTLLHILNCLAPIKKRIGTGYDGN